MRGSPPSDARAAPDRFGPDTRASGIESRDVGMYGLRVRSTIALEDWPEPPAGEPHVVIREEPFGAATFEGEPFSARSTYTDGEVEVEVRGVGRFSVRDGSIIRVGVEPGARPEDVRLYLTGAIFGIVLHQRGIYPLHAACVSIDGAGIAFAAPSGSGKSTLVAALIRRGARFVSDDICALAPAQAGVARVWPGAARLKLDGAGASALERELAGLESAGGDRGKYHVPVADGGPAAGPIRLSHVYLLGFADGDARLERLVGLDAVSALLDETYLLPCAAALGQSSRVFRQVAELASVVRVSRLIRPRGFAHLDAVLDLLERDVRGAVGGA